MKETMLNERSVQEMYLDENGHEVPNPVPMQPPVGYRRPPTIMEQIRQQIKQASLEAAQMGAETEEEANDFDVGEDMEPHSPWESDFEPDPALDQMLARQSAPPKQPPPAAASSPPQQASGNTVKGSSEASLDVAPK